MRHRGLAATFAATLSALAPADAAAPGGYRMEEYRAPTPAALAGALVIDTDAAHALWQEGVAFIDVMPHPERPAGLPPDTYWRAPQRLSVPGSIWLPNTGYGILAGEMQNYFEEGLEAATGGDPSRPLVLYCLRDCWMSWNAAKRAIEAGYTAVVWYPEGTDGWAEAGLPLEEVRPLHRRQH